MPTLPTFTVTDATAQRILTAFSGVIDDETGASLTPQAAYKQWLKRVLMEKVTAREQLAASEALSSELT